MEILQTTCRFAEMDLIDRREIDKLAVAIFASCKVFFGVYKWSWTLKNSSCNVSGIKSTMSLDITDEKCSHKSRLNSSLGRNTKLYQAQRLSTWLNYLVVYRARFISDLFSFVWFSFTLDTFSTWLIILGVSWWFSFLFFLCSRSAFIKAYPSIEKRFQIPLARLIFLESWCTCSLKYILHLLHIVLNFPLLSIYGKFPTAQWVECCTANAVPVRMEILFRGTCCFSFFFFDNNVVLFPFYTKLINSPECILYWSFHIMSLA